MKSLKIAILLYVLAAVLLASCGTAASGPTAQPIQVTETQIPGPTATKTRTPTRTAVPTKTPRPTLTHTALPPTRTITATPAFPVTGIPTVIAMENGLIWAESVVPNMVYAVTDYPFLTSFIAIPQRSEFDQKIVGECQERYKTLHDGSKSLDVSIGCDLRITIGKDRYETARANIDEPYTYDLLKNGKVVLTKKADYSTYDPNLHFWNIGGRFVWEIGGFTPDIIVDGVDYNEKYNLQASFKPYDVQGKLIYIARQNDRYLIVFDDQAVGPEFEEIQMGCCGMAWLQRANGIYWFIGRRAGTRYVVRIR